MAEVDNYAGSTAAYDNGDGTGVSTTAVPSMTHAWFIIVGALGALWFLGGVVFKNVRM